ncbi:hypothetical protein L7F22_015979 [Adiantum nelumboides]|nr:hypothetical protein [Adiantum nelumboides]
MRSLPNCCGAIDCTHVNIDLPRDEQSNTWRDRYGNYSMILQGIVDSKMRFTIVNIGCQGSCNDKRVLRNSGIYKLCQGRDRLQVLYKYHCGACIWKAEGNMENIEGHHQLPELSKLPSLIYACCILHNMVVNIGVDDLVHEVHDIDLNDPLVDNPHANEGPVEGEDTLHAITICDDLMEYLNMQGLNNM